MSGITKDQLESKIFTLKNSLSASTSEIGDYKVIKACEAMLAGQPYEYPEEIRKARQEVRDEINRLQAMLDNGEYENSSM